MDKIKEVEMILKRSPEGIIITDIVDKSKFSRSTIRHVLARLEGAKKVSFRKIGMAKVYTLKKGVKNE